MSAWWITAGESGGGEEDKEEAEEEEAEAEGIDTYSEKVLQLFLARFIINPALTPGIIDACKFFSDARL